MKTVTTTRSPENRRAVHFSLVGAVLLLSGCASMNANECRNSEWRTIGYEDGVAGRPADRIGQHRKACAKYGVSPDFDRYQLGRDEGLRVYCQPANGFRVGEQGNEYGGVCPEHLENAFLNGYTAGHHLFTLQSRVTHTTNEIEAKRHELKQTEEKIAKKSEAIVSSTTSADERSKALVDTKQLAERKGRLKEEIHQLEQDKAHFEAELDDFRATVAVNR
jgi:Protein of unknown function (DUF2799)